MFKVNNTETRSTAGTSIVNFEHISHFILLLSIIVEFEQKNAG